MVTVVKNYPKRRLLAGLFGFIVMSLISAAITLPPLLIKRDLAYDLRILIALALISEALAILWIVRYAWEDGRAKEALLLNKPKGPHLAIGAAFGVLAYVILQVLAVIFTNLGFSLESSQTSQSVNTAASKGPLGLVMIAILVSTVVPLMEELFFRGALMNSLRNSSPINKQRTALAILVSSGFFALAHFQGFSKFVDVFLLVWIFCIGVLNACLAIRYKSIWPAVFSHVFYNGLTMLVTVLAS